MKCEIFWSILVGALLHCVSQISSSDSSPEENCKFADTVDLTGRQRFENGTYRYDDMLIPLEQQAYFDYQLKFMGEKITVPKHVRGCVCKKRPCTKLCCPRDHFFSESTKRCEQITPAMNVSWQVEVISDANTIETVNILETFTTPIGLPCNDIEPADPALDIFIINKVSEDNKT